MLETFDRILNGIVCLNQMRSDIKSCNKKVTFGAKIRSLICGQISIKLLANQANLIVVVM